MNTKLGIRAREIPDLRDMTRMSRSIIRFIFHKDLNVKRFVRLFILCHLFFVQK
ncbi:MAG: hypothetical protein GF311_07895 [Candidatus Lokiarchaeota archaeon]|nr:hypothetical protein [Candidatus Lokiarchaeota archaeon]